MSICLRRLLGKVFFLLLIVAAGLLPAYAQAAGAPKYDLTSESKFKVTVQDLKLPAKGSEKEPAHLLVTSGQDTIDVYLCPKAFLDDMGASFTKGDEITVTGSKIKQNGTDLVLAREVVKGPDTLMLRDEKGKPVWSWHK